MFEKVKTRIIDSIEHDTDGDRADYVNKYDKKAEVTTISIQLL